MPDSAKEDWELAVEEALAAGETIQVCTEDADGNVFWCLIEPKKRLCTELDAPVPGVRAYPPDMLS